MKAPPVKAEDGKMPLLDHLVELRRRLLWSVAALIVAFIGAYVFAKDIYAYLAQPLAEIMKSKGDDRSATMIFTNLTDAFFVNVKVAFFAAAFATCPVFLTQIWKFIAPGLYKNERKAFGPYLVLSPVLFLAGAAMVYYVLIPMAWSFFLSFETPGTATEIGVQVQPKVDEYLALVMMLVFAFGLCFQLPVVMTLLARAGIASSKGMAAKRRYAILVVFIFAAIFTPPDPLSQLALAIPIIVLYEISIVAARLIERKKKKAEADAADEEDDDGDDGALVKT